MGKNIDWQSNRTLVSYRPSKNLKISDFCDMEQFEQVLRDWARSTGLATRAMGADGEYLGEGYNFTDFARNLSALRQKGRGGV